MSARIVIDPQGRTVRSDDSEVRLLLCCHGQSKSGKAWVVSTAPDGERIYFPKALAERGASCGGFERMDRNCQRELITIYEFSVPKFKAVEKGLWGQVASAGRFAA